MRLNRKKGVSGVIVTVLLILVAIAAVGMIFAVVIPFIEKTTGSLEGSADCTTLNLKIKSAVLIGDTLNVKMERVAGDAEITKLQFFIEDSSGTIASDLEETISDNIPKVGEVKTIPLNVAGKGVLVDQKVKFIATIGEKECNPSTTTTITS